MLAWWFGQILTWIPCITTLDWLLEVWLHLNGGIWLRLLVSDYVPRKILLRVYYSLRIYITISQSVLGINVIIESHSTRSFSVVLHALLFSCISRLISIMIILSKINRSSWLWGKVYRATKSMKHSFFVALSVFTMDISLRLDFFISLGTDEITSKRLISINISL